MLRRVFGIITEYFALWVIGFALLALFFPEAFSFPGPGFISPLLGLIMFGMGLTLRLEDLRLLVLRPWEMVIGCAAQFLIMPLLALLLCWAFRLDGALAVGVILVGCCPGGTSSNVMTFLARGDLALSVAMTSLSTLLAPVLTPLLTLLLAGSYVEVDAWGMLLGILEVVILPIALGFFFRRFLPVLSSRAVPALPAFSSLAIMLIVVIVVSGNSAMLRESGLMVLLVVACHNLLGYLLGYSLARMLGLDRAKCRAVCIEVGMQNSGLACSLARQGFQSMPQAAVPGAVFSVWHNVSGAMVARLFLRLSAKG